MALEVLYMRRKLFQLAYPEFVTDYILICSLAKSPLKILAFSKEKMLRFVTLAIESC
jgi:hypothetical protein